MTASAEGHLLIHGWNAVSLAKQYGTPLYVVNRHILERDYTNFKQAFSSWCPKVEVCVSYKTNPLPAVLRILHSLGGSAEVISHFELWLALKLGVPPENIVFNGPCKTPDSLGLAVSQHIKLINIDNHDEIEAINTIAGTHNCRQQVGVRLITSVGWAGQFGMGIHSGAAWEAFRQIGLREHLSPVGLHLHLGTGIKDIGVYLRAIRESIDFARELKVQLGITIAYLDIGGGFGVSTVHKLSPLDEKLLANGYPARSVYNNTGPSLIDYGRSIGELIHDRFADVFPVIPVLLLEPGRALMSSAQSLLVSVVAVKSGRRGTKNVIVDGGKNITMPLGYEHHEALVASKVGLPQDQSYYNVYGPLCHPGDVLFLMRRFPRIDPGDVLAVMDAGAYFVPNQMNFSNPRPAVVLVEDGRHQLVRERETFENIVALDNF